MISTPEGSGIYRITCIITGKFYIGSTKELRKRYQNHFGELQRKTHNNRKLQHAFNKHGINAFTFEVIELVLPAFLLEREQYWLDKLQPFGTKGFNIDRFAGSTRLGYTFSPESREKMRISHMGQVSPNRGKKASPETRAKQSAAKKGKPSVDFTPEVRAKISAANLGREVTPETRAKLRVASTGRKHSKEARAKIAAAGTGRKLPTEAREKVRLAQGNTNGAKDYIVTSPEGVEYTVHCLTEFCKEHGLTQQCLSSVASGKRKHHRGWAARLL